MERFRFDHFAEFGVGQVVLTLTMPVNNMPLPFVLGAYSEGLIKFVQHDRIKKAFRLCNVLYDLDSAVSGFVHPHVHLICVRTDFSSLVRTREVQQIWRECLGLDFDPPVGMKKIPPLEVLQ